MALHLTCAHIILVRFVLHSGPSSTFFVNGDAYILPYRLHTYLGLNSNGFPYKILVVYDY